MHLTYFDYFILALIFYTSLSGVIYGFVQTLINLSRYFIYIASVWIFSAPVAGIIQDRMMFSNPAYAKLCAICAILFSVMLVIQVITVICSQFFRHGSLGSINRLFGLFLGALRGWAWAVFFFAVIHIVYGNEKPTMVAKALTLPIYQDAGIRLAGFLSGGKARAVMNKLSDKGKSIIGSGFGKIPQNNQHKDEKLDIQEIIGYDDQARQKLTQLIIQSVSGEIAADITDKMTDDPKAAHFQSENNP